MELDKAIKILKELRENKYYELANCWDYGEESKQAIDTVLNELDNRISVKKVEQLINKIKNETWYIEGGTEAKQACIEELESLLNKE